MERPYILYDKSRDYYYLFAAYGNLVSNSEHDTGSLVMTRLAIMTNVSGANYKELERIKQWLN